MYGKVKGTVPKVMMSEEDGIADIVLATMAKVASMVGSTLGPGGRAALLERQEEGLPPVFTKDGVTVFRALGFSNCIADNVMQAARDVAIRTANEAGDGTTTATILAEALVRLTHTYCKANPRVSPQWVVRRLTRMFVEEMEPLLVAQSVKPDSSTEEGQRLLHAVAKVSANGDVPLADAVIKCVRVVGDEGNVTLVESSGPDGYTVEKINGYPIPMGYDESCRRFYSKFINDEARQRVVIERPSFLLYHGRITDIHSLRVAMERLSAAWEEKVNFVKGGGDQDQHPFKPTSPHVVVVATEFSDNVLGNLAHNFAEGGMKVFPLLVPQSPIANGQAQFLLDLAAVTGARIMDQINLPLDAFDPAFLGPGVQGFEAYRFRANVLGHAKGPARTFIDGEGDPQTLVTFEELLLQRIRDVQVQITQAESIQDSILLRERLAKLTCGIARLIIVGASNAELKERRDRAEDAVCAVRGAIKHGCMPGAGWGLLHVAAQLDYPRDEKVLDRDLYVKIIRPALEAPLRKLLRNSGAAPDEIDLIVSQSYDHLDDHQVYDAVQDRFVDAWSDGLLDSTPAVVEALRNAISIGAAMGQLGCAVGFPRDEELERRDAASKAEFLRTVNSNPANERA